MVQGSKKKILKYYQPNFTDALLFAGKNINILQMIALCLNKNCSGLN